MITEGSANIDTETPKVVSKKMEVFYNPVMELNRTISVLVINNYFKDTINAADPLAGTGIRAIRLLKETDKIKNIDINDHSEKAIELIKKNLKNNSIKTGFIIHNKDANIFLLESGGYQYIEIDPFGTPNPFLDAAINRLSRNGILAVTATDTAALAGTYQNACKRKYWAVPKRNYLMHEIGLRILIRKIQLIGVQFEKALTPILSYSKDHYYRVFLKCEKGKERCDKIQKQHDFFHDAGPLWTGKLNDTELIKKMLQHQEIKLLQTLKEESKIVQVGFYSLNNLKMANIPKIVDVIQKMRLKNIKASRTHFSPEGIKAECDEETFLKIVKK